MKKITLLLLSSMLLCAFSAYADHENSTPETDPDFVDRTHRTISDSLSAPSRWFDSFFSDPRSDEEFAGTLLRLRGSATINEGDGVDYDGKVKARLRLPNLKRRLHLILSSEEDDIRDANLKDRRINKELADNNDETTLALQYTQERSTSFSLTHRIGLDLEDGLNPDIRSRVRYSLPIADQSLLTLAQAVFWENEEGFGEETRIDYDIPFRKNMLLRTTGRGLFSESSNGYEWLTLVEHLTSFSHKKAISVGAFTAGETRPQNHVTEYNTFVKYRQAFIKKWLFFELNPEVSWLREKDFKAATAFTLTLEIQFGDIFD